MKAGINQLILMLTINNDAKTSKGTKYGYLTGILYLVPAGSAGLKNLCPHASAGCKAACLYTAGRGKFNNVQSARIAKTRRFLEDRESFLLDLEKAILALSRKAERENLMPAVRLNGTSDIAWESLIDMSRFPGVQFYDYTKNPRRMKNFLEGPLTSNYHLTFSRSECNHGDCIDLLRAGGNVAMVFDTPRGEALPSEYEGFPVVDGDMSDLRFLDTPGSVVGLRAKGDAFGDSSGFVIAA